MTIQTSKTRLRFSRRALLRRMGVGAAALPLLHAGRARAAGPKRLVTIVWANGVAGSAFYPTPDDPTASEIMKPLAPLRSKVLLTTVDLKVMLPAHQYDGHFTGPVLFTGSYQNAGGQNARATSASIDQVHADNVARQANLPMPIMPIAITGGGCSYRADGTRNTAERDPGRLFARMFSGSALPAEQVDALRLRRKSVLDFVGGELQAFAKRLGTEDRAKIATHEESIRQLEKQLSAAPGQSQSKCGGAPPPSGTDFPARWKAVVDLTALALRCDVTRSVSISSDVATGSFQFLGVAGDWHGIAHAGPGDYAKKIKIDTWFVAQLADLAKQLDATAEGGRTLLDNSVLLMMNQMNEGSKHYCGGIPTIIVGSGGGYLRTGRYLKLSGVANNRLLASVANALDVRIDSFGAPGHGGPLAELGG